LKVLKKQVLQKLTTQNKSGKIHGATHAKAKAKQGKGMVKGSKGSKGKGKGMVKGKGKGEIKG
jgi:hypothetical protein